MLRDLKYHETQYTTTYYTTTYCMVWQTNLLKFLLLFSFRLYL